ncbi:MAG: AlpA family transcriptional regulator [Gammaproteobacteria bacterium]|nr:AlpA family transcriptional regulator [Gammaproteobacteria bacterium]MDH4314303.1 AlpA family transcriptional regulator [Gammaproteobacteria bacterium]MDH5215285.1 AlpA family transcriptional regulator [Gammaproteobacteria bacterium]
MTAKKFLRLPEVIDCTGLSRSTIYEMIRRGEFPPQICLGPRVVGWTPEDVQDWACTRINASRNPKVQ